MKEPTVGGRASKVLPRHELTSILEPRAAELAKLVYDDLAKAGLENEIRSGVVLAGGGARLNGMPEMIEQIFFRFPQRGLVRQLEEVAHHLATLAIETPEGEAHLGESLQHPGNLLGQHQAR